MKSLDDLLRESLVRLDPLPAKDAIGAGSLTGTGYFVSPGHLITCAHVVGDQLSVLTTWNGRLSQAAVVSRYTGNGRPLPDLAADYPDLALVQVPYTDHPCVDLEAEWPAHSASFLTYGFPSEGGAILPTPIRLSYRGRKGVPPSEFLDLAADSVKHGMSGGPLLNLETGRVCGTIVATRGESDALGGLAVPFAALKATLKDHLIANRQYHFNDPSWDLARLSQTQTVPRADLDIVTYLQALQAHDAHAPYLALADLPMERVYVEQFLRPTNGGSSGAGSSRSSLTLRQLVGNQRWILVEGGPGTGKSTMLRNLSHRLSVEYFHGRVHGLIPVRLSAVKLAQINKSLTESIREAATIELGRTLQVPIREGLFDVAPSPGHRWIILIDSLDAIRDTSVRQELIQQLSRHVGNPELPYNICVMTRPLGESRPLVMAGFSRYEVLPFSSFDLDIFVARMSTVLPALGSDDVPRLLRYLRGSRLSELTRVPLLLTLAVLTSSHERNAPARRAALYEAFVSQVLADSEAGAATHQQELAAMHGSEAATYFNSLLALRRELLEHVAAAAHRDRTVGLRAAVRDFSRVGRVAAVASEQQERLLIQALGTTGMVDTGDPGTVQFAHETIGDYFAACDAVRRSGEVSPARMAHMLRAWRDPLMQDMLLLTLGRWSELGRDVTGAIRRMWRQAGGASRATLWAGRSRFSGSDDDLSFFMRALADGASVSADLADDIMTAAIERLISFQQPVPQLLSARAATSINLGSGVGLERYLMPQIQSAIDQIVRGGVEAARKELDEVIRRADGRDIPALSLAAGLLMWQEQDAIAAAVFLERARASGDAFVSGRASVTLSAIELDAGHVVQSRAIAAELTRHERPEFRALGHAGIALVAMYMEDFESAISELGRAENIDPTNEVVALLSALAFVAKGGANLRTRERIRRLSSSKHPFFREMAALVEVLFMEAEGAGDDELIALLSRIELVDFPAIAGIAHLLHGAMSVVVDDEEAIRQLSLATDSPVTMVREIGELELGRVMWRSGNYARARQLYGALMSSGHGEMAVVGAIHLSSALEREGKLVEAFEVIRRAAESLAPGRLASESERRDRDMPFTPGVLERFREELRGLLVEQFGTLSGELAGQSDMSPSAVASVLAREVLGLGAASDSSRNRTI